MKQIKKWSKNRFFIAMLLAVTLLIALYYYSAYGQVQEKINSLKEAAPAASPVPSY